MLSFFYSVWAHRTIDAKRLEMVELHYPKRPAEEEPKVRGYWGPALQECEMVLCFDNTYSLLRDKTVVCAYKVREKGARQEEE